MEIVTISSFLAVLALCLLLDASVLYALVAGLFIFCAYGLRKGYSPAQLWRMLLSGIKTAKNMLIVFVLIGMLTALWRACGAIPQIICYAVRLIRPRTILLMSFLLNCGVSMLTGTSVGTAATMGVICMTTAASMGASPVLTGGAILAGAYFGDRCSPVSTSALLVCELTGTNIFSNVAKMLRTALLPFALTCAIYGLAGLSGSGTAETASLQALFGRELTLHWCALLPAAIILVLSVLRLGVKTAMLASIASAALLCLLLQRMDVAEVLLLSVNGFRASDAQVGALLNGGGILSMLNVMAIVCISSSYAGIFQGTGLLDGVKGQLERLSARITPFGSMLVTSVFSSMIACNQTLAIMLTHQLCGDLEPEKEKLAISLENSVVVIAPLIPWCIAGAVPRSAIGAPVSSLFAACFLYLLPLCTLLSGLRAKKRTAKSQA